MDANYPPNSGETVVICQHKDLNDSSPVNEISSNTVNSVIANEVECSESCCDNCSLFKERLLDEQKRCTILRANIHKVSANWFQRKTQISESETDAEVLPVCLLNETTRIESEHSEQSEDDNSELNFSETKLEKPATLSKDFSKLVGIIAQKSAQLDLADSQVRDLKKRMREYERIIDHKEDIVHGLKDQLESYLTDNQNMAIQLTNLACLFKQLEKVEKETVAHPQPSDADTDSTSAIVPLPTQEEFQEMASSVSRTYIKLKDLIYEKKALVTEIERLNTLNVELQRRVVHQETRLVSVSDALHQTWLVVSDLKEDHEKLHNDELILKYELKEKREILNRLRTELESARSQWQTIRQMNIESELEYTSIREMLQERRKTQEEEVDECDNAVKSKENQSDTDDAVCLHPDDAKSFDPPIDLLVEMGIEYGIIGENAEMTQTVMDVIGGEDVRDSRLDQLEEHCSLLYQKLISSTSRSLSLASRLSRLHQNYGPGDDDEIDGPLGEEHVYVEDDHEDDSDDEEGEEEVTYFTDANHQAIIESVLSTPDSDSEEYDTAYVSETDGAELHVDLATLGIENLPSTSDATPDLSTELLTDVNRTSESSDTIDYEESCDHLSRTLINFLPKKIEFLKAENKRLELSLNVLKEDHSSEENRAHLLEKEKQQLENQLKSITKDMTIETIQRKQLEEQLKHLGKCVDELKLKHQAESKRKTDRGSNTDDLDWSSDPAEEEEVPRPLEEEVFLSRPVEEKIEEDAKMRREVELLKKDMDLKKREKDLRKREDELHRRENQTSGNCDQQQSQTTSTVNENVDGVCLHQSVALTSASVSPAPECQDVASRGTSPDLLQCIFDAIQHSFPTLSGDHMSCHDVNNSQKMEENYVPNSTSTSSVSSEESSRIPVSASAAETLIEQDTTLGQEVALSDIKVQPTISLEDLRDRKQFTAKISLTDKDIFALPLYMTLPEVQLLCQICPSKPLVLVLLQLPSNYADGQAWHSASTTTEMSPTSSSREPNESSSVLVPASRVPDSVVTLTVQAHRKPGIFVVILRGNGDGPATVEYEIRRSAAK